MDLPHIPIEDFDTFTLYDDGTAAALEELIGNHGGLGGEQTDALIFHPSTVTVPETRNAVDVFPILDGLRGDARKGA